MKPYLTVYGDIWNKKIWSMKDGVPVSHKTLQKASEYARKKGFCGIRVKFKEFKPCVNESLK